jgi:hypothetical protein
MPAIDYCEPKPCNPIEVIPTPSELRRIIGTRYAELTVLRRLLKVAEEKARLCPARQGAANAS